MVEIGKARWRDGDDPRAAQRSYSRLWNASPSRVREVRAGRTDPDAVRVGSWSGPGFASAILHAQVRSVLKYVKLWTTTSSAMNVNSPSTISAYTSSTRASASDASTVASW